MGGSDEPGADVPCGFSAAHYEQNLRRALDKGYRFPTFAELADQPDGAGVKPSCLLRHDVDVSLKWARRLATIEVKLGVRSTFFIRLRANGYNALARSSMAVLWELATRGFEIGLHAEPQEGTGLRQQLVAEREILQMAVGREIAGLAIHRPKLNGELADDLWRRAGFRYEAGEQRFNSGRNFASDSNYLWKPECFCRLLERGENVYACVHPVWYWSKPESAGKILSKLRAE